ncbi:MAG TPA: hypothetical protein VFB54_12850 [Burkholderiales bacterium]|nr:hypothetical protein [Burkholderiales bacterium]
MHISYPYAHGDLLEQRHHYFYSSFQGPGFLTAWERSRAAVREKLRARSGMIAQRYAQVASPTLAMISALRKELAAGALSHDAQISLDKLVQRFEVSKRLHRAYDEHFKPLDASDYRDLDLYVEFAALLVAAADTRPALSYLNALLKCMDILSAAADSVPVAQCAVLVQLLDDERRLVALLAEKVGVRWTC